MTSERILGIVSAFLFGFTGVDLLTDGRSTGTVTLIVFMASVIGLVVSYSLQSKGREEK